MEITTNDFLKNIKELLGLNDTTVAIAVIIIFLIFAFIKFFNYIINRVEMKDDKQFEVLYKIIEDEHFIEKLRQQPYLIKQIFYKRFYLLKNYQVEEIEFLLSQNRLNISLYEIESLKSGKILVFKNGRYRNFDNKLIQYWANHYWLVNFFILVFFILWIAIWSYIGSNLFNSTVVFNYMMIPLFVLEVYLLWKVDLVKTYQRTRNYILEFVIQSENFSNNRNSRIL